MKIVRTIFFLFVVASVLYYFHTHIATLLTHVQQYCIQGGILSILYFSCVYIIAILACVPGSVPTVLAGVLFGSVLGSIIVIISASIASVLAFLLSRYCFRNYVTQYCTKQERFQKFQHIIEQHGAIIVVITRLIPLFPFSFLNYAFGITNVRLKDYTIWSTVCIIPGVLLYVVGADVLTKLFTENRFSYTLGVVVIVMCIVIYYAQRYIKQYMQEHDTNRMS